MKNWMLWVLAAGAGLWWLKNRSGSGEYVSTMRARAAGPLPPPDDMGPGMGRVVTKLSGMMPAENAQGIPLAIEAMLPGSSINPRLVAGPSAMETVAAIAGA
jgi:hypothetical protein